MSNATLYKSYIFAATVAAFRIVAFSALDTVTLTTAATDSSIGVNGELAHASGERGDVVRAGIAYVEAGAAVAAGAPITSDSTGRGITAAPATGANVRVIGFADEAASAAGDVIRMLIAPSVMQG